MAARERLQVVLELVAGQYKREAKAAATATGQVADAAKRAGTATGSMSKGLDQITKDASNAGTATGSMSKGLDQFSKSLRTVVSVGGLAVVARQAVMLADRLGDMGIQLQAWNRRAETVFGDSIALARRWADAQNEAFGMGEQALLGMLAATGDLLVPMGFAREAALGLSQTLLEAANATSAWTGGAVDVESAAQKIQKAMLGEREGLIELGIKISDADVKQRLLRDGKTDLTGEAEKQAVAEATLALVYEQSADALSAAADGTTGLLDARKQLEAAKADAWEKFAEQTLPAFTQWTYGAATGASLLSTAMGMFDSSATDAEKKASIFALALENVNIKSGQTLSGVAAFAAGVSDTSRFIRNDSDALLVFARSLDLTEDELQRLILILEDSPELFNLNEDAAQDVADALTQQGLQAKYAADAQALLAARTGEATDAEIEHEGAIADTRAELYRANALALERSGYARSTAQALWDQVDAENTLAEVLATATSPLERFIGQWQRYQDMVARFDETAGTPAEEAAEELAMALGLINLEAASLSPDEWNRGIEAMMIATGKTRDEVLSLFNWMGEVNGQTMEVFFKTNYSTTGAPSASRSMHGFQGNIDSNRAAGGPVSSGSLYQVGENNRPELFMIPGDNGQVFSNSDSRALIGALSGAGGSNLTINMQSQDPNIDAQRVAAMAAIQRRMETT